MIARELLDRGAVRRLAVICPAHLCDQWEGELRELLQGTVARGKVDVNVTRSGNNATDFAVETNTRLALAYVKGWGSLQSALRLPGQVDLSFLLARPDLVRIVERR